MLSPNQWAEERSCKAVVSSGLGAKGRPQGLLILSSILISNLQKATAASFPTSWEMIRRAPVVWPLSYYMHTLPSTPTGRWCTDLNKKRVSPSTCILHTHQGMRSKQHPLVPPQPVGDCAVRVQSLPPWQHQPKATLSLVLKDASSPPPPSMQWSERDTIF